MALFLIQDTSNPLSLIMDTDVQVEPVFEVLPPPPTPSTSIQPSLSPVPSQTPMPSFTPQPSLTPIVSIDVTGPVVSQTPIPSSQPQPTPSPTPVTWRSCIDGILRDGNAPVGYQQIQYSGQGGGMCWEPVGTIGFNPPLTSLLFTWQRGSPNLPQPITIVADNPSYGLSYSISITTNPDIIITPSSFTIPPRGSVPIVVNVTPALLNALGDGNSTLFMDVNIQQV